MGTIFFSCRRDVTLMIKWLKRFYRRWRGPEVILIKNEDGHTQAYYTGDE